MKVEYIVYDLKLKTYFKANSKTVWGTYIPKSIEEVAKIAARYNVPIFIKTGTSINIPAKVM